MARIAVLVAGGLLLAAPALAHCDPPPGLSPLQWYSVCGSTLQEAYQKGGGHGLSFEAYTEHMYRIYLQPVTVPAAPMGACDPGRLEAAPPGRPWRGRHC